MVILFINLLAVIMYNGYNTFAKRWSFINTMFIIFYYSIKKSQQQLHNPFPYLGAYIVHMYYQGYVDGLRVNSELKQDVLETTLAL